MKIPKIDVKTPLANGYDKVKDGVKFGYEKVKPSLNKGVEYAKNLTKDTVNFAKKNPKKTGLLALAGAVFGVVLGTAIGAVKANKAKNEHIYNQRVIINALKNEVGVRQEIIETYHDAMEASSKIKNQK